MMNVAMDHQSLYRKYRPQTFDDVLGQQHVTRTLANALKLLHNAETDKTTEFSFPQAYLFCGPRGTGKTTTARILAKALNCAHGPTPTPCGKCDSCQDIARGSAMDVLEIDAASNTGVDNVREVIISKVNFKPALGRYRMYIIDEAHQLSNHAFNALLKTIEEPPPHAVFVLATTEFQKVPATIQSRCQRHLFHHISNNDIAERLKHVAKHEGVNVDGGAVYALAKASGGALRDALSLLEQMIAYAGAHITEDTVHATLGTVSADELEAIVIALENGDAGDALQQSRAIIFRGIGPASLAHALAAHTRDRLVDDLGARRTDRQPRSIQFIELFAKAESDMRWNASHDLVLELALLKCCALSSPKVSAPVAAAPAQEERRLVAPAGTRIKPKSEPPPASTPTAQEPPGLVGEASLTGVWPQVLDRVKQKGGIPLLSQLREGVPTQLEGNRLIVTFGPKFEFHCRKVTAKRNIVEDVLREFTGVFPPDVELDCQLGQVAEGDLVREAMNMFGGKIVQ